MLGFFTGTKILGSKPVFWGLGVFLVVFLFFFLLFTKELFTPIERNAQQIPNADMQTHGHAWHSELPPPVPAAVLFNA